MINGTSAYRIPYAAASGVFVVGIYCRLSKDDDLQGESASISNQRELLTSVSKAQGWNIAEVYQDDGFTGLNMDRPGLQKLLHDIELGRINLVITKDLSRLGRNYLQTGHLIEDFFPRHGVRYIALNDGIDTQADSNEIAPFKNILNEMYSRDISKKVHSSYMVSARKGSFTGCVAPLGYKKDPDQHGHLLIDEETAPIIRHIFDMALQGYGPNYIRRRLEEERVPCPAWWNRQRGWRNTRKTKWETADPENGMYMWDFTVIKDLLMNPVYVGCMASQKRHYRFKIGTIGEKRPDEWLVVEGTHEPIVDRATFDIVQEKLRSRQRVRNNGELSLFAGILKCGECGKALTHRIAMGHEPKPGYCCKTYNAFGKGHCTQHRILEEDLTRIVLDKIQECAAEASVDSEDVAERLRQTIEESERQRQEKANADLAADEARLASLTQMVTRLYEDRMMGRISEENFSMLMAKTQTEQEEIRARITLVQQEKQRREQMVFSDTQWREAIRQYANITELDPVTLNRLIQRIVVHEEISADGERTIKVEIHFNMSQPRITE